MWYIDFLNKKELYMKHLLILLCVFTLASCGIKNRIWNLTSDRLGVPKQSTQQSYSHNATAIQVAKVHQHTAQTQPIIVDKPLLQKKSFELKWYYILPFVGLVVLAILVYLLKQQNLKSL